MLAIYFQACYIITTLTYYCCVTDKKAGKPHVEIYVGFPTLSGAGWSKEVIIVEMYHDILYPAVENVTKPVYRIYFYIFVMPEPVELGTVDIVIRI